MQKLKLNQLNKQKVADREMNAIKGGTTTGPNDDSIGDGEFAGACYFSSNNQPRAMMEYLNEYYCIQGEIYLLAGISVI